VSDTGEDEDESEDVCNGFADVDADSVGGGGGVDDDVDDVDDICEATDGDDLEDEENGVVIDCIVEGKEVEKMEAYEVEPALLLLSQTLQIMLMKAASVQLLKMQVINECFASNIFSNMYSE
jgi:hypothetical protein